MRMDDDLVIEDLEPKKKKKKEEEEEEEKEINKLETIDISVAFEAIKSNLGVSSMLLSKFINDRNSSTLFKVNDSTYLVMGFIHINDVDNIKEQFGIKEEKDIKHIIKEELKEACANL